MFVYIVYQSNGTPAQSESLISRVNPSNNIANPFITNNNTRSIGNGNNSTQITSPINIRNQTIASLFNANIDSNELTYNEYNLFQYKYSGSITNYNDTLNNNKLFIGTNSNFSLQYNGLISEILIFNEPLTQEEKYSVEGYLAYKWNLQMYLPLYHPLSPIIPASITPLLFSSLQLWMDASNTSSIIKTNNNVTQWNDLSYNKNNAITNTNFNTITTGLQNLNTTLIFNGSVMDFNNPNILSNSTNATLMFLVYSPSSVTTTGSSSPFSVKTFEEWFPDTDGNIYSSFGIVDTNIGELSPGWSIFTAVVSYANDITKFYINGILINSLEYNNSIFSSGFQIGSSLNTIVPLTATLTEMLVFNEELTNNQRILMEGYLANKWGVTNLLPGSNPYVSRSPTINDYDNLNNNNIIMNLDANNNNFIYNNNIISSWVDLSSNNNSLQTINGSPILQTNPINNLPGVYFNNNESMIPINNQMVLNNNKEFSLFVIGYINNTNSNNNPTIISSYNSSNQYLINIRNNLSNLNNQISIIQTNDPQNPLVSYAVLSNQFSDGLQNMNMNTLLPNFSVYNNGTNQLVINNITLASVFTTNFYIGGRSSDSNTFMQGYIHKILLYNTKLDLISRIKIEASLAINWNIPTSNSYVPIAKINAYTGIRTIFNIILDNWTYPNVSQVYIGYNTSYDNINNLINLGPVTINQLNNYYYVSSSVVFNSPNTYYFHVLNQNNTEYTVSSKTINVSNLIINTESIALISENTSFNVTLNNWSTIVNAIGLYSNQITNFDLSIGISTTDPSPVFVTNVTISNVNNNYILSVPGLVNVNNKYLYFSKTINSILISIPPILISYFNLSMTINRNYGILNEDETYNLTISSTINPFDSEYPNVYLYYATVPNAVLADLTLIEYTAVSNNSITFTTNQTDSVVYFYISTLVNFSGHTTSVGPIHFIDSTTLSSKLDIYDTNTNTRNILLAGWSPYFREITNLNVLTGSASNYSGQTLYKTLLIRTFTPTNIPNLSLWLDASTINNFIFNNSNNISQWTDGSINNNNATTSSYPIYNSTDKGVNFNGGKYLNLPNGTIPYNDESYHIFIVLTPNSTTNTTQFILGSMDNTSAPTANETNSFFISNNKYIQSWNNGADLQSSNYTSSVKQLVSFEYLSEIGRTTYINTVLSGTDSEVSNESSMYNNMIGGILNNSTFYSLIHEIIIYNGRLSTLERQKVENYLNNKWLI